MEVNFYEDWSKNKENITTYSVYKFVGKLEDILIGSHERRAPESDPYIRKVVNASYRPKDAPNVDWPAAARAAAKGTASVGKNVLSYLSRSHEPKWRSEIQKMFDGAQELIQERQKTRANEIIRLRNAKLESWKTALQDREETV